MAISARLIGNLGGSAGEWAMGSQGSGFSALDRHDWTPIAPTNTAMSDGITVSGGVFEVPAGDYLVQAVYQGGSSGSNAMWARIRIDGVTEDDHENSAQSPVALGATATLTEPGQISVDLNPQSLTTANRTPDFLAITIIRTG